MVRLAVVRHPNAEARHRSSTTASRGAVPEFVLIHGLASNARMWDGVGAALAERGYASIAVDLRGHGRSPKPPVYGEGHEEPGYGFDEVSADVLQLLDDEGLVDDRRPTIVGQSLGGNVVVELAANHPGRIRAVAAIDGGVIRLGERFPDWNECESRLAPPDLAGTPVERIRAWMTSAHPDWPQSGIEGSLANFEVRHDGTIAAWLSRDRHLAILRALWEHDPVASFARLAVPAALLLADSAADWSHDKAVGAAQCANASPVPVDIEWFAGADHDLHAQHPVRTADSLIRLHEKANTAALQSTRNASIPHPASPPHTASSPPSPVLSPVPSPENGSTPR